MSLFLGPTGRTSKPQTHICFTGYQYVIRKINNRSGFDCIKVKRGRERAKNNEGSSLFCIKKHLRTNMNSKHDKLLSQTSCVGNVPHHKLKEDACLHICAYKSML